MILRLRSSIAMLICAAGCAVAATDSAAQSVFLLQLPSTDGKDAAVTADTLASLRLREAPTEMPVREPLTMLGRFNEVLQEVFPGDLADMIVSVQLHTMQRELQDPVPECGRPITFVGPNLWPSDIYASHESADGKNGRINLRFSYYQERCDAIRLMALWVWYDSRGPYGTDVYPMDRSLLRSEHWKEVKAAADSAAADALSCVSPQSVILRPVSYRKGDGEDAASWIENWHYEGCGKSVMQVLQFDYTEQNGLAWQMLSTSSE